MKNKLNTGHYFILVFFVLILIFSLKSFFINDKVAEDGMLIIVKLDNIKRLPKRTNFHFSYYYDGKKLTTTNCGIKKSVTNNEEEIKNINNLEIGAFYIAKFLPEYPKDIRVDINKKMTDTLAILKAGFSKEDIANMPK